MSTSKLEKCYAVLTETEQSGHFVSSWEVGSQEQIILPYYHGFSETEFKTEADKPKIKRMDKYQPRSWETKVLSLEIQIKDHDLQVIFLSPLLKYEV